MVAISTILGPIIIHDRDKDTEKSSAQVLYHNTFDSRLYRSVSRSEGWITFDRIREIRRDATVQLARQAVVSPMIHTPWNYIVAKGAPKKAEEFLRENLEDKRDWFLQNAVYNALDFGWAPFEVVYKKKDRKVCIDEFKQLIHDYTTVLVAIETGKFAGLVNEPILVGGVAKSVILKIPNAANFNLVVEGTDWYGESVSMVLDPIMNSWKDVEEVSNRYDRKIAGATWVVYYPVGMTPVEGVDTSNQEIAKNILAALEASGAVAIPDEIQEWLDDSVDRELKGKWRVELISPDAKSHVTFTERQRYLDALKIRAFGIPERAILEGKFGTKAEAETHSDIALSTIDTKHRLICDQMNVQVVSPLLRINYGEKYEKAVQIAPAPLVDAQFQLIREIYRLLVQSPQIIAREVENIDVQSLRDQIGVPTINGAPNDFSDIMTPFENNKGDDEDGDDKEGSEDDEKKDKNSGGKVEKKDDKKDSEKDKDKK